MKFFIKKKYNLKKHKIRENNKSLEISRNFIILTF